MSHDKTFSPTKRGWESRTTSSGNETTTSASSTQSVDKEKEVDLILTSPGKKNKKDSSYHDDHTFYQSPSINELRARSNSIRTSPKSELAQFMKDSNLFSPLTPSEAVLNIPTILPASSGWFDHSAPPANMDEFRGFAPHDQPHMTLSALPLYNDIDPSSNPAFLSNLKMLQNIGSNKASKAKSNPNRLTTLLTSTMASNPSKLPHNTVKATLSLTDSIIKKEGSTLKNPSVASTTTPIVSINSNPNGGSNLMKLLTKPTHQSPPSKEQQEQNGSSSTTNGVKKEVHKLAMSPIVMTSAGKISIAAPTTSISTKEIRVSSLPSSGPGSGVKYAHMLDPMKVFCNCKKTHCLKLYCDCFRIDKYCDGCNCVDCFNISSCESDRQQAMKAIMERSPSAFDPRIATKNQAHVAGCKCKKSNCLKKYCECFTGVVACTDKCRCVDCRNGQEHNNANTNNSQSVDKSNGIKRPLSATIVSPVNIVSNRPKPFPSFLSSEDINRTRTTSSGSVSSNSEPPGSAQSMGFSDLHISSTVKPAVKSKSFDELERNDLSKHMSLEEADDDSSDEIIFAPHPNTNNGGGKAKQNRPNNGVQKVKSANPRIKESIVVQSTLVQSTAPPTTPDAYADKEAREAGDILLLLSPNRNASTEST